MTLTELPKKWFWAEFADIGQIVTGTTPKKAEEDNYGHHIPFVKPGDLDRGTPIRNASEYLSEKGAVAARTIPAYSTMVTCIGATIGKTGFNATEVATNQQINSVVPAKGIEPKYVYYYCLSNAAQEWIVTHASSTTLPILNKTKFSRLPMPVAPLN